MNTYVTLRAMRKLIEAVEKLNLKYTGTYNNDALRAVSEAKEALKDLSEVENSNHTPQLVIRIEGGLIQEVYTDRPMEIVQLNTDTEDAYESEIITYPDDGGNNNSATAWYCQTDNKDDLHGEVAPEYVHKVFEKVLPQLGEEKEESSVKLSKRETATVLAALRQFQNTGVGHPDNGTLDFFEDTTPLTDNEIDDLCERINLDS